MRAGSPSLKRVVCALGVRRGPCRVEVAPKNGAGETSSVMLRQEVMNLVKDILRRRKVAVPGGLKEVSKFRVEGARGSRVEDWDVNPQNEEIRSANVKEHGAQAASAGRVRCEGNSSREAWAFNDELSPDS